MIPGMASKPDPMVIAPRWAKPVVGLLALLFIWFALDRYIAGLDGHKRVFGVLAPEYGETQLDVLAASPALEFFHRVGGAVLITAGLMQFSTRLRRARPKLHRGVGYLYIVLALGAGISGVYMGIRMPYGGVAETIPVVLFGAAMVVCTIIALWRAKQRRFEIHREWMARSFALLLGPIAQRSYYLALWTLLDVAEPEAMWIGFWLGWGSTYGAVELWIAARKRRLAALREAKPRA